MFAGDQLYECTICLCERKWGEGKPEKQHLEDPLPLLMCKRCKIPTRHRFSKVDFDYLTSLGRAKQSPLPTRFEHDGYKSWRRSRSHFVTS